MDIAALLTFLQTQEVAFDTMLKEVSEPDSDKLTTTVREHNERMINIVRAKFPSSDTVRGRSTTLSARTSRPMFTTPPDINSPKTTFESPAMSGTPTPARRVRSGPNTGMFTNVRPQMIKNPNTNVRVADSDDEEALEWDSEDESPKKKSKIGGGKNVK
ncbi:uncharacterized protein LY89DRAFT_725631 [Mollisia scopiformis]|uniref:Uncharacterized protein n=1 Tax=Mollisia scopiformis TaxID=149040 RepID=A0A132B4Y0_MOLSC|nr:uncharacterized protein LY89DRAFT_725631 [Mollisia scopiformis]KUJ07465.1 hypothetical protein LY89DRAFT_725631 [Mollisia scopiformis]